MIGRKDVTDEIVEGYFFNIVKQQGKKLTVATYSHWTDTGWHGREQRKASVIDTVHLAKGLELLGNHYQKIATEEKFRQWLKFGGMALVSSDFAEQNMKGWMRPRYCLKHPKAYYLDLKICHFSDKSRSAHKILRDRIKKRDGWACRMCGTKTQPTMHHILPYSKGGMTIEDNLILLCKSCNQKIADNIEYELFDAIGIDPRFDESILKTKLNEDTWKWMHEVSGNMMYMKIERKRK